MLEQLKKLPFGKIQQFKIPIALSLVGLVLILGGILLQPKSSQPKPFPKESIIVDKQNLIAIDVSGAVKNPGVYKMVTGSRIEDAVKISGGFSTNANFDFIAKNLNLAAKLSDGAKIYIPFEGENQVIVQGGSNAAGVNSKININTSTQSELESLSGIGPVTASKIISGRPYQKTEDLLSSKVVSKSVFEKIKDQIVVY